VSAYIGYKMAGVPGAVMAVSGTVLPTTLLMLLMIAYFFNIKDSPTVKSMLQAVRPVVVGFLLWTAYDMAVSVFAAKKLGWSAALSAGWDKILIVLGAFVLLTFTRVNPIFLIAGAAALGFVVYR
jgi:chromate transporter